MMAENFSEFTFEARKTIIAEGDAVSSVFFIAYGSVSLSKSLADGRCQIVDVLGPEGVFDLGASPQSSVTVKTLEPSGIRSYPRHVVEASSELQAAITKSLLDQVQALHQHAVTLGCLTSTERVASFLLAQSNAYHRRSTAGDAAERPAEIVLKVNRSEIADYLGLSTETVARQFVKLKRKGIIAYQLPTHVAIVDRARLRQMAGARASQSLERDLCRPSRAPADDRVSRGAPLSMATISVGASPPPPAWRSHSAA